jgi:hypothetical protein
MKTLADIQADIAQLSVQEVQTLARWLAEYLAIANDIEIETDIRTGRTDRLLQRAQAERVEHEHHHHSHHHP